MDVFDHVLTVPLYHGTDVRIVEMSKEERCAFKADCNLVTDYLWGFFKPYYEMSINYSSEEAMAKIEELKKAMERPNEPYFYSNFMVALSCHHFRESGNELYQYWDGVTYLTNDFERAKSYARGSFAFGEIGRHAYSMITAMQQLMLEGYKPDENVQKAVDRIVAFAEAKPQPVVVAFNGLKVGELREECGGAMKQFLVDWIEKGDCFDSLRCIHELDFSKGEITRL